MILRAKPDIARAWVFHIAALFLTMPILLTYRDVLCDRHGCLSVVETCDRQGWRKVEQRMEQLPRWSRTTRGHPKGTSFGARRERKSGGDLRIYNYFARIAQFGRAPDL